MMVGLILNIFLLEVLVQQIFREIKYHGIRQEDILEKDQLIGIGIEQCIIKIGIKQYKKGSQYLTSLLFSVIIKINEKEAK